MLFTKACLEPFYNIRHMLNEKWIPLSEIVKQYKISQRQLLHWEQKKLRMTPDTPEGHGWRKFSIMDLFGFAVVKRLRRLGLGLEVCEKIIRWMRKDFYEDIGFIHSFSIGRSVHLLIDIDNYNVNCFYGIDEQEVVEEILNKQRPMILIPLSPILRAILKNTKAKYWKFEFVEDKFGNHNQVIYHTGDREFKFNLQELIDKNILPSDAEEAIQKILGEEPK